MSKNNQELTSRKWKKQRELVFRTKGRECYICREYATAVDHVISRKRGGGNNIENLEPICKSCNSRKGSKEYSVFLGRTPTPPVFPRHPSPKQSKLVQNGHTRSEPMTDSPFNLSTSPDQSGGN